MNDEHDDDTLLNELGGHARDRHTREALRPLSDDFNQRMADQIKAAVSQSDELMVTAPTQAPRAFRPFLALAAGVVLAIGMATTLIDRAPQTSLPGYTLEFRGGAQLRSEQTNDTLQMGDQLQVVLRPESTVNVPVTVTVFRNTPNGWVRMDANVAMAPSGAARVTAMLDADVGVAPGDQELVFVVSPDAIAPHAFDDDKLKDDWQIFRQRFALVP